MNTKARKLLPAKWDLLYFSTTDTVGAAFQRMAERNVYAVPVFDKAADRFVGFLGFNDVVHNVVHFFAAKAKLVHPELAHDVHQLLALTVFHQTDADNIQRKVFAHSLGDLVNVSACNPWHTMPDTASLQEVIDFLVSKNIARIALVNNEDHVTAVLSESVIVRFLANVIEKFESVNQATLRDSVKGSPLVEASEYEEKAIACFAKLDSHKATHLPLSSEGKPQGNLSLKDIRAAKDSFERLIRPVGEFVAYIRQQNMKAIHPYMHANETDTLGRAISRFAATGVHTMYLTDLPHEELDKTSSYPPVAVISLRNLLAPFASH